MFNPDVCADYTRTRTKAFKYMLYLCLAGGSGLGGTYLYSGNLILLWEVLIYTAPAILALVALKRNSVEKVGFALLVFFLIASGITRLLSEPSYPVDFIVFPAFSIAAFFVMRIRTAALYSFFFITTLIAASAIVYYFKPLPTLYSTSNNPAALWVAAAISGTLFSIIAYLIANEGRQSIVEVLRSRAELSNLNKDYQTLLNVVIHDLANDLQVAQMSLEKKDIERAIRAVDHISGIVENLRRLKKTFGTPGTDFTQAATPVADVFSRLRLSFSNGGYQNETPLEFSGDEALKIKTDPIVFCAHILGNLVNNAFKYSTPESKVRITAAAVGQNVAFTVENTAYTNSKNQKSLSDILNGKKNIRRPETLPPGGQGLGLELARDFAKKLGGSLVFEVSALDNTKSVVRATLTTPQSEKA